MVLTGVLSAEVPILATCVVGIVVAVAVDAPTVLAPFT